MRRFLLLVVFQLNYFQMVFLSFLQKLQGFFKTTTSYVKQKSGTNSKNQWVITYEEHWSKLWNRKQLNGKVEKYAWSGIQTFSSTDLFRLKFKDSVPYIRKSFMAYNNPQNSNIWRNVWSKKEALTSRKFNWAYKIIGTTEKWWAYQDTKPNR